jgi:hypothetical protein
MLALVATTTLTMIASLVLMDNPTRSYGESIASYSPPDTCSNDVIGQGRIQLY